MPITNLVSTFDFSTFADKAAGAAGSTIATGTNSVPLIDINGSTWSIVSGVLVGTPSTPFSTNWSRDWATIPSNKIAANQSVYATVTGAKLADVANGSGNKTALGLMLRNSGNSAYILGFSGASQGVTAIYRIVGTTATLVTNGAALTGVNTAHTYELRATANGSAISLSIYDVTAATTVYNVSGTDANLTTGTCGANGWLGSASTSDNTNFTKLVFYDDNVVTTPLTAGTASLTSRSPLKANVNTTAPTNGTGTGYTYQWQVSTDGTTYNNVAGATNASLAYTASSDGIYYLRCNYSDSGAGSATSNVLTLTIAAAYFGLLFVGDSITYGDATGNGTSQLNPTVPDTVASTLGSLFGYRMIDYSNQGHNGAKASDWQPGSGYYNTAIAAGNAFSANLTKRYAVVMFGANEMGASVSKATYKANLLSLINGLISNGYTVILNAPLWSNKTGYQNLSLISQYRDACNELVNGTTILQGDTNGYNYFLNHSSELVDLLHPNQTGAANYGVLIANAIWRSTLSTQAKTRRSLKL